MTSITKIVQRRHRRQLRRQAKHTRSRLWFILLTTAAILLVILPMGIVFGGTMVLYGQAVGNLPAPVDTIASGPILGTTELYDASGSRILYAVQDPLGDRRTWVTLDQLPSYVAQATLLREDADFLIVTRFDAVQTVTKLWRNLLGEAILPADQTLTGRLVRNVIDPQPDVAGERWARMQEIALVAEINRRYSPREVLEWHLNTNYYGNEIYGIDAAAQIYLGKRAVDLTLDEAALLAAIPLQPDYNPVDNITAALGRRDDTLRLMLSQGVISEAEYQTAARHVTPVLFDGGQRPSFAPEFALYARHQAEDILDRLGYDGARMVSRGGLRITTTLDVDLYLQSECVLRAHLAQLAGRVPDGQTLDGSLCNAALSLETMPPIQVAPDSGTLVILDVNTGEIKSMVGSATEKLYQPGPTLYPFVYLTGFLGGNYSAGTMVLDIPSRFPGAVEGLIYTPTNPDGRFYGVMNLRDAMGAGLLPPVASVAQSVGISNVAIKAQSFGLVGLSEFGYDLSLLERGGTVSVMDMAYAYNTFATLGQMIGVEGGARSRDPVAVLKIEDSEGKVLWEYDRSQTGANCTTLNCTGILEASLSYIVNDILADQETRWNTLGETNILATTRHTAVVNGTTGDDRDDWTIGYTPQLLVAVNLSRTDRQPLALDNYGLFGAAVIWRTVMDYAHNRANLPNADWLRPDNLIDVTICELSGLLPNGNCQVRREIFREGTEQLLTEDTFWKRVEINTLNSLLASPTTPDSLRSQRIYFVPPAEAMDWWVSQNRPLPPTNFDTVTLPDALSATQILQPLPLDYIGGRVDIRGSMDESNFAYYQLSYGAGATPDGFFNITDQVTTYAPGTTLGIWDTSSLDGQYTLQLLVVLKDGKSDTKRIFVIVDNLAPTLTLSAGEAGQVFQWPRDEVIPLVADAQDNRQVQRVEFYHNGQFIGTDEEWPYGFDWEINRTGTEFFSATVFDAVGNSASAEIQVEVVRSGE
jgi:membrane carboxypeptidase/penicillin-binding protein